MRAAWVLLAVLAGFAAGFFLYSRVGETERAAPLAPAEIPDAPASSALAEPHGEPAPAERRDVPPGRTATPAPPAPEPETTLEVVARDVQSGAPLAGLRAFLGSAPGEEPPWTAAGDSGRTFATDQAGQVSFAAVAGRALILSFVRDDAPAWPRTTIPPLVSGERREMLVELPTGVDRVFCGRVLDDATGQPIEGCRASVSHHSEVPGAVWRATSDAEGRFELRLATWQMIEAGLLAGGYPEASFLPAAGHELPERAVLLRLGRAAVLAGEVEQGNGPLARVACLNIDSGAFVLPRRTEAQAVGAEPGRRSRSLRSIRGIVEGGAFRLEGLPPGVPATLELHDREETFLEGGVFKPPAVLLHRVLEPFEPGEERWIGLHLATAEIRGHIVDQDGEPLVGVQLWRRRAEYAGPGPFHLRDRRRTEVTRSLEAGSFSFPEVPVGSWWVGPGAELGAEVPAWGELVEVRPDEEQVELELQVWRGLTLAGRVVDAAGHALAKVIVVARETGAAGRAHANTDEDGTFTLRGLRPVEHEVTAGGPGSGFPPTEPVLAHPGRADLLLRVGPAGALLVRVVGEQVGIRPAMCDVILLPGLDLAGHDERLGLMLHDAHTFQGLTPGTYAVLARSDDGRIGLARGLEVRAGDELARAEVRLEQGAGLRLVGGAAAPLRFFTLVSDGLIFASGGLLPSRAVDELVPAGRLVVRLTEPGGGLRELSLDLAAGEFRELDVDAE